MICAHFAFSIPCAFRFPGWSHFVSTQSLGIVLQASTLARQSLLKVAPCQLYNPSYRSLVGVFVISLSLLQSALMRFQFFLSPPNCFPIFSSHISIRPLNSSIFLPSSKWSSSLYFNFHIYPKSCIFCPLVTFTYRDNTLAAIVGYRGNMSRNWEIASSISVVRFYFDLVEKLKLP